MLAEPKEEEEMGYFPNGPSVFKINSNQSGWDPAYFFRQRIALPRLVSWTNQAVAFELNDDV